LLSALLLSSCKEEPAQAAQNTPQSWGLAPGSVQVLNSCGVSGAAGIMRDYLHKRGFNVIDVRNDPEWANYPETVVALRDPEWPGRAQLARALHTQNFIPLQNKNEVVQATIFVGRDFQRIMDKQ
jgi:hypothetical protein